MPHPSDSTVAPFIPRSADGDVAEGQPSLAQIRRSTAQDFSTESGTTLDAALARSAGLIGRPQIGEIEAARKKGNPFVRTLLAGNKFGVFKLPGGLPMINPVKSLWSGLGYVQHNVSDPAFGLAIGVLATGLSELNLPYNYRAKQVSEQFKGTIFDEGLSGAWQNAGDFTRGRESLFVGDKLLGSLIFDPTTYIGFGVLGKVPIAGRLLGPLEGAYMDFVAYPFRWGGRQYAKLPKTRGITERLIRGKSDSDIRVALPEVLGTGESFTQIQASKMKLKQIMGRILNVADNASSKLTRKELFLRQTVVQTKHIDIEDVEGLLELARFNPDLFAEGAIKADNAGLLNPNFAGYRVRVLAKIQDDLEAHVMGRLSTQEVAPRIVFTVGGRNTPKTIKLVEKWVETNTETILRNAERRVSNMSPRQFADFYSQEAGRIYRQNQAAGFNEWKRQQGVAGAMLGYMDNWQTKWYQQRLRANVIRPMATNVLGFFAFGGQEAGESILRQFMGRSGIGFRNQVEGSATLGLFDNVPNALLSRETETLATRGAAAGNDSFSLSHYIENKFRRGRGFNTYITSKLKYLNARTYVSQAGNISQQARTQFLMNRAMKRNLIHLNESNPEIVALLDEIPAEWIGGKTGQRLWEDAIIRASSGNTASLRNLIDETFNVRKMNTRELADIVDKYGGANGLPPDVVDDIITRLEAGITGGLGRTARVVDRELGAIRDQIQTLQTERLDLARSLAGKDDSAQAIIRQREETLRGEVGLLERKLQPLSTEFADLSARESGEIIRTSHSNRSRGGLASISDRQLEIEAKNIAKTHVSGLDMGATEFRGTYLSTEAGNRNMRLTGIGGKPILGTELFDATTDIQKTRIFRDPFEYNGYKEQFFPEGVSIDDASPQQIEDAVEAATKDLELQGFDSVYLPESAGTEGILVVFDRGKVTLTNGRKITSALVAFEEEASRRAIELGDTVKQSSELLTMMNETIETQFDDFVQSADGMLVAMEYNVDQLALAESEFLAGKMTQAEVHTALENMNDVTQNLSRRVEQINTGVMNQLQLRGKRINRFQKQALFDNATTEIESMFTELSARLNTMTDTLRRVETTVFKGDGWFATSWRNDMDALQDAWTKDKKITRDYFRAWGDADKTDEFWEGYRSLRSDHWGEVNLKRYGFQDGKDQILKARRLRDIGVLDSDINPNVTPKDFTKRGTLSLEDIGHIIGRQSENVTQAIIGGSFYNPREFRQYVMKMAREGGHTGVTQKKVEAAYASVLDRMGFNKEFHTAFEAKERGIRAMFDELDIRLKSPKFGDGQEAAAREYLEKVATHIDEMPTGKRAVLKRNGQRAMDAAGDDLKAEFVNYDGNNFVDDLFQGAFPFFTYESRRMAWLLQKSFDHPSLFANVGPEGRYWEATDNGYVNVVNTWMDLNFFGGTMMNTPRRLFRAEFPPHDQGGIRGFYSQMEQQLGQYGFYFGSHITAALEGSDLLLGKEAELGEALPPFGFGAIPLGSGGLAAMEFSKIPLVSQAARTMRNQLFHDRFREWGVAKVMIERGLPLDEVDFKNMKPIDGALEVTQDDINDASWRSAGLEFIAEAMGNVRFRGPAERKYRDSRDQMYKAITGLTLDEINAIRWDGVSITSLFNLPPDISRQLGNIPDAEQFSIANQRLQPELVAEASGMISEFWRQIDITKEALKLEQEKDNAQWMSEENPMSPARWAVNRTERGRVRAGGADTLRGITRGAEGEVIAKTSTEFSDVPFTQEEYEALQKKIGSNVIPLRHEIEELTETYFEIKLSFDENGEPLWGKFFTDQVTFEDNNIPESLKGAFFENLDHSLTDPEAVLRDLRRGIIRDYFAVERTLAIQMGTTELLGSVKKARSQEIDLAEILTAGAQWKVFDRAVTAEKERMRTLDPRLDYALNIFGIIGEDLSFKSNVARQWYREDGQRPNMSRLD